MRALQYTPPTLTLNPDAPLPVPGPDQARIRVRLAGICATDLALTHGYAGFSGTLGHEFVGEVVQCAPPHAAWIGQRVVGEINLGCGACPACLRQRPHHCPQRRVLGIRHWDGALAEYCVLPVANLHPVPAHVTDEAAVFTEPLAAALEILEQVHVPPDCGVTVVGDGKLGLLVAQVLALGGNRVRVAGHHPERAALLARWGAEFLPADALAGASPDPLVVECSGVPAGLELALGLLAPEGTLVLKSTFPHPAPLNLSPLVVGEQRIVGSRCGPFAPALRLLAAGRIETAPLIAARYPLEQGVEAMQAARGALKVLVAP